MRSVRSCEDVDETALSYAEIKALCAGNPLIKEKMDLDIEVARLRLLKANHQSQRFQMEDRLLKYFPVELEKCRAQVGGFEADLETRNNHPLPSEGFVGMEVLGHTFSDKEDAGKAILEAVKTVVDMKSVRIGHYRGFEMSLELQESGVSPMKRSWEVNGVTSQITIAINRESSNEITVLALCLQRTSRLDGNIPCVGFIHNVLY